MNMDRKWKNSITMILTLLLLISSIPSYGAAARFKDVPNSHWAYTYIEDMAKLGYLGGYPDGTFVPSGKLTFMESMSALSRFVDPNSTEKSNAINGYNFLLNELKVEQTWEREGLSIALHKGIISENELRNANAEGILKKPISRETIALFLAKAMGLEEMSKEKSVVVLPFTDAEVVNSKIVRYVDVLLDVGVLSRDGQGGGMFEPRSTLTRAELATMLSKGYDYLEKNPISVTPEEPKSVETETIKATIKRITDEIGRKILVIDDRFGGEEGYIIESTTSIIIDGKTSNASSLSSGQEVELKVKKNTKELIAIESVSIEEDAIGIIKDINSSSLKMTLEYKDGNRISTKDYTIDNNAKVYLDEKSSNLKDLKEGSLVELRVRNNTIFEIEATSKIKKANGVIIDISPIKDNKDSHFIITIEDKEEVTHKFYTDSKTRVYRKNKSANEKDLKLKDYAYIEAEYDLENEYYVVDEIDADVDIKKVKGNVTQITNIVNQNTLVTIKDWDTGKEEAYELTRNAYISVDKKIVSSLPPNPGYYVEVVLEGDEIVEVYADSTSMETSIVGKIRSVDYNRGIIDLEVDNMNYGSTDYGMETKIYSSKDVVVTDRKLTERKFRDLRRGDMISIVGTREGVNFVADTIQIR